MNKNIHIAGIGASAGGLAPLIEFFKEISPDNPMAYVVVTHLLRDHKSTLAQIIAKSTAMPVIRLEKDSPIEAGKIYVMIENTSVTMEGDTIRVHPRNDKIMNYSVDIFLDSLAASYQENALGIILSGMGRDGLKGTIAIKAWQGLVYVQDPHTSRFTGMPDSVIENDHPNLIDGPKQLAAHINRTFNATSAAEAAQ